MQDLVQLSFIGEKQRLQMDEAITLTRASLEEYGRRHRHWAIAYSGGKDSTSALTVALYLIESGQIPAPETLAVLYADTRLELLPLAHAAAEILADVRERGYETRTVMAPLDQRFLVYILGRGVPPANNNTLRWCTRQIKVDPMARELERLAVERGTARVVETPKGPKVEPLPGEKVLVITGVRQGESAIRDGRIAMSCSKNGAECGQGWYQETLPEVLCDTLAPMLHWRVCHVWEWLRHWAPRPEFGDWHTEPIADAYGGNEAEELNARTGCVGCPLAQRDTALDSLLANPRWEYLAPLKELRPLWRELRKRGNRLRKWGETKKDGTPSKSPWRMGPITLEARAKALEQVLSIQARCNAAAERLGRPRVDILNPEEEARIRELIALSTWPDRWDGTEALASAPLPDPSQLDLTYLLEAA